MRHRIYVHLTWTTRDRVPCIDAQAATFLQQTLSRIAHQEPADVLTMGIVTTHVHLAIQLHPATAIPRLLQRLKGPSAALYRRESGRSLRWAKGYNVDSVGTRARSALLGYVMNQPQHHPDQAIAGWVATANSDESNDPRFA